MPEIICVVRLSKLTKLMDNFVLTTLKQLPRNSMGHWICT